MKAELDRALRPFRILAAAWSGGVMLGPEKCDDFGYAELLKSVAETGELPECIESGTSSDDWRAGLGIDWSAGVPPADSPAESPTASALARRLRPTVALCDPQTREAGGTPALRRRPLHPARFQPLHPRPFLRPQFPRSILSHRRAARSPRFRCGTIQSAMGSYASSG